MGLRDASRGSAPLVALFGAAALSGACVGIAAHFARQVLTPSPKPDDRVEVLAFQPSPAAGASPVGSCVWLRGPEIELEGGYSFIFDARSRLSQLQAGHARLGPVIASTRTGRELRVLREVLSVDRGELRVGARGRITGWWFAEPEQLGHEVRRVALPLPNGVGWGWVIAPAAAARPDEAQRGRWAIHVHGRGAMPHETLRGVVPFAEAGVTSLVISYRNDPGAPAGRVGRYGLGIAESEDVEAAIGWALGQGAERITLVGWSMGATACVLAANGRHAPAVEGMVLDSPALDWREILQQQARLAHLPAALGALARAMLSTGFVRGAIDGARGTDLGSIGATRLASLIRVPTLIHASPDDTFVPWGASLRIAKRRSRLVRLRPARGEHVKLWNVDPEGWVSETARFISNQGAQPAERRLRPAGTS